jgi:protein TonB
MAGSVSFHVGLGLLIIAASSFSAPREQTEPPEQTIELAFEPPVAPTSRDADQSADPTADQGADPIVEQSPATAAPPVVEAVPDPPPPPPVSEPLQAAVDQPPDTSPLPEPPVASEPEPLPVPPRPRRIERHVPSPQPPPPRLVQRDAAPASTGGPVTVSAEAGLRQGASARAEMATAVATSTPDWRAALMAWLQGRKFYPEAARRQGLQGRVLVRFSVGRDGEVHDAVLVQGSEHAILNEAAMAMLRGARAPAFTADMTGARINVTVPITFSLSR